MATSFVLAIDPGREKCGVAVVDEKGIIVSQAIVARGGVVEAVGLLVGHYGLQRVTVGHATASKKLEEELVRAMPAIAILRIDETGSTLEARHVYWQENPPKGWRKMVPLSLQNPPEPIDGYAAVVLARRSLNL